MATRRTKPKQQELRFRSWGGRRPGAGRKRSAKSGVSHIKRSVVSARHPVHITLKLRRDVGNLRTKTKARAIKRALIAGQDALGFQVVDWSVQGDHVHLTCEAHSSERLSRGMQGLMNRMARKLNSACGRKGKVFADRYHVRVLKTPREVRNCRAYVLNNARRHAAQRGRRMAATWVDPYSSWASFDGWKDCPVFKRRAAMADDTEPWQTEPRTWLMRKGWRRHGLIRVAEIPGCPS